MRARELDERVYRQEFRASFENLTSGGVYYAFERSDLQPLSYDPQFPLCWSLHFNIDPASACYVNRPRKGAGTGANRAPRSKYVRCMPGICTGARRHGGSQWRNTVCCLCSGASRRSVASRTDWEIVREFLAGRARDYNTTFHVDRQTPELKDRINCVNAVIANARRERRLTVSPQCKQLIRDLEQVSWKHDANGNPIGDLDGSDRMRTHTSDVLGYLIASEFPMRSPGAECSEPPFQTSHARRLALAARTFYFEGT